MEGSSSDERRALVAELVQVLDAVRQLQGHMLVAGQLGLSAAEAAGGEERCRALVSTMRASIDRSVHIARSCCPEPVGRLPVAVGQRSESPLSDAGDHGRSPLSAGSDQAGNSRGRGNAAGQYCKKRKTLPKWSMQVRVRAVQDVPLDDGLSWRKYGQKDILGAKYPRAYFRCTHRHTQGCHASKQVQRTDDDPLLFEIVYHGNHTCAQADAHHNTNEKMRPAAAGVEHSQALEEQTTASAGFEGHNNKRAGANDTGGATTSGFPFGCVAASPFVAPATSECPMLVSGSYTVVGGGSMAGARNVPDVELASATNSPMVMGGMDFMFPPDNANFLENPSSYF